MEMDQFLGLLTQQHPWTASTAMTPSTQKNRQQGQERQPWSNHDQLVLPPYDMIYPWELEPHVETSAQHDQQQQVTADESVISQRLPQQYSSPRSRQLPELEEVESGCCKSGMDMSTSSPDEASNGTISPCKFTEREEVKKSRHWTVEEHKQVQFLIISVFSSSFFDVILINIGLSFFSFFLFEQTVLDWTRQIRRWELERYLGRSIDDEDSSADREPCTKIPQPHGMQGQEEEA